MTNNNQQDYRADIDGLRAIAVSCVVVFHTIPRVLPGGFVGVDIFFVISGFLISGIIFKALQARCFSYIDFYIRRIKRIFPALLTVLATLLVAGWILFMPEDLRELGKQTAAAALFAANLLFWEESGYFDVGAQMKPLLHLWSLGVEEQFYLTWPLIIAFLYRHARQHLPVAIVVLLLTSFGWNLLLVTHYPASAYFLPMTRFWELLLGSLLAYRTVFAAKATDGVVRGSMLVNVLSLCGCALLALAFWLIDEGRPFPGWWALLPTLGTLLLISTPTAWFNRNVLCSPPVVFVGLISYPLYLWHWALLAVLRIHIDQDYGDAPGLQRVAMVGLSFVLAWLTYVLIEKPVRFGPKSHWRPVGLLASMGFMVLLGWIVYVNDGASYRYPAQIRSLADQQHDELVRRMSVAYRSGTCLLGDHHGFADIASQCVETSSAAKPLILLWGDSHAASLYPGLKAQQDRGGKFRVAQFTVSGCPPVIGMEIQARPSCKEFNDDVLKSIASIKPEVVLIEADWWYYRRLPGSQRLDFANLRKTVEQLKSLGVARVVVFGDLPGWKIVQRKVGAEIWLKSHSLPRRTYEYFEPESAQVDDLLREAISTTQAVFVSPIGSLCNKEGCLLSTSATEWTPVSWDTSHLTDAGADILIESTFPQIIG